MGVTANRCKAFCQSRRETIINHAWRSDNHAWKINGAGAGIRKHDSRSAIAMSGECLIGYARYQDRALRLKHCEATLLEERLGLRRKQVPHVDRRHAVSRPGKDCYRINDRRMR